MQALVIHPSPHKFFDFDDFAFTSQSFSHDFTSKLELEQQQEEEEQEFSFASENRQGSLVTADEIFHDGKIRPLFPIFLSTLELQGAPEESFQSLSLKTREMDPVVEDSKEMCKKSNSTGFSKMLRLRQDMKLRSYSNDKDAFVFLNPPAAVKPNKTKEVKVKNEGVKNGRSKMAPPTSAEKLYVMNRKRKESNKRRSFLPYKQQLFGFFANMNGFSKNLHPF